MEDDHIGHSGRPRTVRTDENINRVETHFTNNPSSSLAEAERALILSATSIRRMLKHDLDMFPYRTQLHQPLSNANIQARFEFANKMVTFIESETILPSDIWFSDEYHFGLRKRLCKCRKVKSILIFSYRFCLQTKLAHMGNKQPSHYFRSSIAPPTHYRLVRHICIFNNWANFYRSNC